VGGHVFWLKQRPDRMKMLLFLVIAIASAKQRKNSVFKDSIRATPQAEISGLLCVYCRYMITAMQQFVWQEMQLHTAEKRNRWRLARSGSHDQLPGAGAAILKSCLIELW
jgi:hypothetical protein